MIARTLLILALLVASTLARSDGIYNPTVGSWGFQDGINGASAPAAPPPSTCSGTGLIFNVACNSQYIGIL